MESEEYYVMSLNRSKYVTLIYNMKIRLETMSKCNQSVMILQYIFHSYVYYL